MTRLLKVEPYSGLIKLFCALALLPVRYIRRGFVIVVQQTMDHGIRVYRNMRRFIGYVRRHWVFHPIRRQWMCVFGSFHRTNNTSGGFYYISMTA